MSSNGGQSFLPSLKPGPRDRGRQPQTARAAVKLGTVLSAFCRYFGVGTALARVRSVVHTHDESTPNFFSKCFGPQILVLQAGPQGGSTGSALLF